MENYTASESSRGYIFPGMEPRKFYMTKIAFRNLLHIDDNSIWCIVHLMTLWVIGQYGAK